MEFYLILRSFKKININILTRKIKIKLRNFIKPRISGIHVIVKHTSKILEHLLRTLYSLYVCFVGTRYYRFRNITKKGLAACNINVKVASIQKQQPEMFCKKVFLKNISVNKGVLRIFGKFTGKHLCKSLFFLSKCSK